MNTPRELPKGLVKRLREISRKGGRWPMTRSFTRLVTLLVNEVESLTRANSKLGDLGVELAHDLETARDKVRHSETLLVAAERQRDEVREALAKVPENGRVTSVTVGSGAHDGRGFFTIGFEFDGSAQAANIQWGRESMAMINGIIRVCGARDLLDCKGKYVRVLRNGGRSFPIIGITHIVGPNDPVYFWPQDEK